MRVGLSVVLGFPNYGPDPDLWSPAMGAEWERQQSLNELWKQAEACANSQSSFQALQEDCHQFKPFSLPLITPPKVPVEDETSKSPQSKTSEKVGSVASSIRSPMGTHNVSDNEVCSPVESGLSLPSEKILRKGKLPLRSSGVKSKKNHKKGRKKSVNLRTKPSAGFIIRSAPRSGSFIRNA